MVTLSNAAAALLSTGFISLVPNLILLVASFDVSSTSSSHLLLTMGQSLAAGALLGDVFLHTLPHAKSTEDSGLWILGGFSFFLIADLVIRSAHGGCNHDHTSSNSHSNTETSNGIHRKHDNTPTKRINASSSALNLIADSLHNFTDGLAIGASFTSDASSTLSLSSFLTSRGGLATISIMFHEIPHELGDFCTLLSAGYTRRQAIAAQFFTAIAAFLGTVCSLFISDIFTGDQLVLATAGTFIYLASVTILPEVLNDRRSFWQTCAQLAAFLCGIAFMRAVALLESHDHHDHASHHHHHEHHHHHDHGRNPISHEAGEL